MNMVRTALTTLVALTVFVTPASAATFVVTSLGDAGDGTCDATCTVRDAVAASNADVTADTITVPAGTFTLSGAQLTVNKSVTINGAGATSTIIDANHASRVFNIVSGAIVTITDLSAINGDTNGFFGGAGIMVDDSNATLQRIRITGATSNDVGGGLYVFSSGTASSATVEDSVISGNSAEANTGSGGGVFASGAGASLTLRRSTVANNSAFANGGGIFLNSSSSATIERTTITGNSAKGNGGGIVAGGLVAALSITHSTIVGNTADSDNGGGDAGGGLIANIVPTISNSIVANNLLGPATASDCNGTLNPTGTNIIETQTSCNGLTATDLAVDPQLGSAENVGNDQTGFRPTITSPAVDAANTLVCDTLGGTDQRGGARSVDGNGDSTVACDIGAIERGGLTDARATATASTASVKIGAITTWTVTVDNPSSDPIVDAGVSLTLTGGTFVDAVPTTGSCTGASCSFGALEPGASASVTVRARAGVATAASLTATTSTPSTDSTTANNSASASTSISNPRRCTILGTTGAETIVGTSGNDVICALGGNDRIRSGAGNDVVYGDDGNDSIAGGNGNDSLVGGNGRDTILGEAGKDTLTGGAGKDVMKGGAGNDKIIAKDRTADTIDGGAGRDSARVDTRKDKVKRVERRIR